MEAEGGMPSRGSQSVEQQMQWHPYLSLLRRADDADCRISGKAFPAAGRARRLLLLQLRAAAGLDAAVAAAAAGNAKPLAKGSGAVLAGSRGVLAVAVCPASRRAGRGAGSRRRRPEAAEGVVSGALTTERGRVRAVDAALAAAQTMHQLHMWPGS